MAIQSEAALEAGLIATLQQMDYEYVQIAEDDNLQANFKRQLETHNRKRLAEHGRTEFTDEEFDKILIYLEEGTRFEKEKKLREQLWEAANKLRCNMSANDFMYFTLGGIFYKCLSEKIEAYANNALVDDEVSFKELWTMDDEDAAELQEELKKQCMEGVGCFIEPTYLFSPVIDRIKKKENIKRAELDKEIEVYLKELRIV